MTWRIEEGEDRHHHYFRMYLDGNPAVIGSAVVRKPIDGNPYILESILTYKNYRRKGYGSALLRVILGYYHCINGKVEPFSDKPMITGQLTRWYRSHGFCVRRNHRMEHGHV